MKKKRILFDMRYLKYLNDGFGQLTLSYGLYFLHNPEKYSDLDITLIVPSEYIGKFGDKVKYIKLSKKYKLFPFLLPQFDIAHSITQQIKYTPLSNKTYRIITIHDLNFLYQRTDLRKVNRKLKQFTYRLKLADIITTISKFTKEDLLKNVKDIKAPIILNYEGVRDSTHDATSKPVTIDENRPFFFTISHISPKKNVHILLDLMKLIPDYNLYIAGNNSSEYAQMIAKRIKDEKIANVFMTGALSNEEKVWAYKNCQAFFFPSKFEGFGIPVIEAMRFDKPVFCSRMTSLADIGGDYAFFWDSFNAVDMKNIIDKNLQAFYQNTEFRQKQLEYAFSFSMEKHMEGYLNMYRELPLEKKGSIIKTIKNYLLFMRS